MKEFMLIFRPNGDTPAIPPSPEEMQQVMSSWMVWFDGIRETGKLANPGNRLSVANSKTVRPGGLVTDGPYTEIKEFINGYIMVKTATIDEAVTIAQGCPILQVGGTVEVRTPVSADDNG